MEGGGGRHGGFQASLCFFLAVSPFAEVLQKLSTPEPERFRRRLASWPPTLRIRVIQAQSEMLLPDVGGTETRELSCYSKAKCNTLDNSSDPKPGFKLSLPKLKVVERISQRRQLIQDCVAEVGRVPSVRKMSELLAAKGCEAGRQTICADYHALGYAKPAESQAPLPIEVSAST